MIGSVIMMCVFVGIMLGVAIAIGYIVYKDAKALGLNAWLWAIMAVVIPNFIGVIIYLVVRSTTAKKVTCSVCGAQIKEDYNVCPECGSNFTLFCKSCKRPIESGLKICPYCGEAVEEGELPKAMKVFPKTNISKSIGIIVAIFLGTVVIGVMGAFGMINMNKHTGYVHVPSNVAIMNVENNMGNKHEESFYYKNGESIQTFSVDESSHQLLTGEVYVKKGSIVINVEDNKGNNIFSQEFTPQEDPYAVQISLDKADVFYKAHITYNKARGKVNLRPE